MKAAGSSKDFLTSPVSTFISILILLDRFAWFYNCGCIDRGRSLKFVQTLSKRALQWAELSCRCPSQPLIIQLRDRPSLLRISKLLVESQLRSIRLQAVKLSPRYKKLPSSCHQKHPNSWKRKGTRGSTVSKRST